MHRFKYIAIGFFITFLTAWVGLAIVPSIHYGKESKQAVNEEALLSPHLKGEEVYAANGCVYCHTQQVRSPQFGNDHVRGWGERRTVSADYQHDRIAFLGTMRTGPDLANVGTRIPSKDWHFQHLYDPESTTPGSIMPKYRYLFDKKPVTNGTPDPDAVSLNEEGAKIDSEGYQRVPSEEAKALVEYLLALKRTEQHRPEAETLPIRER